MSLFNRSGLAQRDAADWFAAIAAIDRDAARDTGALARFRPAGDAGRTARHFTFTKRYGKKLSAGCAISMFDLAAHTITCWCSGSAATSC